jgi:hypothetical protein
MLKGLVNVVPGVRTLKAFLTRRSWSWYDHETCEFPDVREFVGTHFGVDRPVKKSSPRYRETQRAVEKTERSIERFLGTDGGRVFHPFPQVKTMLGEVGEDYADLTHPWNGFWWDYREMVPTSDPIGVVGYTHEPGFKFRAFAAPNPVLQAALEPMKKSLLKALSLLPWDCTHDQQSGVAAVQEWLQNGLTVYSVDLSDATNNFPLDTQLEVLQSLGAPEQDLRLLWLVARSPYRKTWGDGECVTWTVGQPLGAAPSFPMFALAHAAVALTAERYAGIPANQSGSTFRILGDDFVCCHPGVHEAYRDLLGALRCPVSEAKCLQSPLAGEFAGKLITDRYVFHGYKYRAMSDLSFMDVVRTLGPQAISPVFLTPKQYDYCMLVKELPEPIGLGLNPKGRPYAERYEEALHILEALEKRKSVPERYRRAELINRVVYQFRHRWWGYLQADKFRSDGPMPKREHKCVSPAVVEESVRGEPLVIRSGSKGDPRPNVLKSMMANVLDVTASLERLGRLRGSKPAGLDLETHQDLPQVSTSEVELIDGDRECENTREVVVDGHKPEPGLGNPDAATPHEEIHFGM